MIEEALNELMGYSDITEDLIIEIGDKYNLSLIEIDELCTAVFNLNIAESSEKCSFNTKKYCNMECQYYQSCTRRIRNQEDPITNCFKKNGYSKEKTTKYVTLFRNVLIGRDVYFINQRGLKIVVHPDYEDFFQDKPYISKRYFNSNMTRFPKIINNGRTPIAYGLQIEASSVEELGDILCLISSEISKKAPEMIMNVDISEKLDMELEAKFSDVILEKLISHDLQVEKFVEWLKREKFMDKVIDEYVSILNRYYISDHEAGIYSMTEIGELELLNQYIREKMELKISGREKGMYKYYLDFFKEQYGYVTNNSNRHNTQIEKFKEWLKGERFMDRVIDKYITIMDQNYCDDHDKGVLSMTEINDLAALKEYIDEKVSVKIPTQERGLYKYYLAFYKSENDN